MITIYSSHGELAVEPVTGLVIKADSDYYGSDNLRHIERFDIGRLAGPGRAVLGGRRMNGYVACLEFEAELVEEYSAVPQVTSLGRHKHRMELHRAGERNMDCIIWNYGRRAPDEDETVIGLEIEDRKVVGYDGVMCIPAEAVLLLKAAGLDTSEIEGPE